MGRGSSSGGGSRGFSSSSGRGWSSSSRGRGGSHTTVIIGGTRYYGGSGSVSPLAAAIICIFVTLIIFVLGIFLIVNNFGYGTVQGTAVSNRDAGFYYYTTYTYQINGQPYVEESETGWELPEEIGKSVKLYYEKDDPTSITEENPKVPAFAIIILFAIGGAFAVGAVCAIKSYVNRSNNSESSNDSDEDINSGSPKGNTQTRCSYCGSKHNAQGACPSCGANND